MKLSRQCMDYAAAYSSFEEIPQNKKLSNYQEDFAGEDVWSDFEDEYLDPDCSDSTRRTFYKAGNDWKETCKRNQCHHALASPETTEQWCEQLLSRMGETSAKAYYFNKVNHFYRYLLWNIEYPHIYNPIQIAVKEYPNARLIDNTSLWWEK